MVKKTVIGIAVFAHLLLILSISAMLFLALVYPFQPGDLLYPVQNAGEQVRLALSSGRESRASYALTLSERRLGDLAQANTPQKVEAAVVAFEKALQDSAKALDEAPQGAHDQLYRSLEIILNQADVVVNTLGERVDLALLQELHSRLALTDLAASRSEKQAVILSEIPAEVVPFYPRDLDHSKFGLFGGHYSVDCMSCHQTGEYAATSSDCSSCHQPKVYQKYLPEIYGNRMIAYSPLESKMEPALLYPDHYAGDCADCHSVYTWEPVAFSHKNMVECLSCHLDEAPVSVTGEAHYPGECKDCHSSFDDWQITQYGHGGVQECTSCHEGDSQSEYCESTCSNCHRDVTAWTVVEFNHSGKQDCTSCHGADKPNNHYDGQCSSCHSTDTWDYGAFEHAGKANCSSCHMTPTNHYEGACSSCHNANSGFWQQTSHPNDPNCSKCHEDPVSHYEGMNCSTCHLVYNWKTTSYNHANGNSDCTDCHAEMIPADHYQTTCEDCHASDSWDSWIFNHTGYTECASCHALEVSHYPGLCSDCHATDDWTTITADHTEWYDCATCHIADSTHYLGLCSDCHNTTNWYDYEMSHTYLYDCQECHAKPEGHWPGQCSSCHSVEDWSDIDFDHTTYTDCNACHQRPNDGTHRPGIGQCSKCHSTDSWIIPTETPTVAPSSTPLAGDEEDIQDPGEDGADEIDDSPPDFIPTSTPKPTSTPDDSDVRDDPVPTPTVDPRDELPTPTPLPPDDPEPTSTPVPEPGDPEPQPIPDPEDVEEPASTPGPQALEFSAVALVPDDQNLVKVVEIQLSQDEEQEDLV